MHMDLELIYLNQDNTIRQMVVAFVVAIVEQFDE